MYGLDRADEAERQFATNCLLARRMVERGVRFVLIMDAGWDDHTEINKKLPKRSRKVDQPTGALIKDLKQKGLLDDTLIVFGGEFGRTPNINPGRGRDHWGHCWSLVVGGGGIKGGQVIGASDERGAYVADRLVTIGDLFATVYKAMGIDWTKTYLGPGKRPIYIANSIGDKQGEPVHELV